jgi:hypothetical protein
MADAAAISRYLRGLLAAQKEMGIAAIVIGFDHQTRFVWSVNSDAAHQLKRLIDSGGRPVAILGLKTMSNHLIWRLDPFEEYADDEKARRYLEIVGQRVAELVEARQAALFN